MGEKVVGMAEVVTVEVEKGEEWEEAARVRSLGLA